MSRTTYEILEIIYALKRQKKIIYGMGILFLASFIISYILMVLNISLVNNFGKIVLTQFSAYLNLKDITNMSQMDIFFTIVTHNLFTGMLIYLSNMFSILPITFNAFILAYVLYISNPLIFILLILPHGIIEIPALLLCSSAGIVLFTSIVYRLKGNKYLAHMQFMDSLRILLISTILFIFAGIIESFITFKIKTLL
ncbi:MAG TPA: stage II sporulation protein M [Methanothermococcus okinawensis]|uniref:Stage II sporulation protein M n=1 Tax=Methanothermococcus okinawensis TaxID=155863 RepID=A0A833DRT6_9EURY|nr:stage II sporulation protein M [Methanothermococcus okinawensis]